MPSSVCKPNSNLIDSTSNQNESRLADLERRVGEIGKLMETMEGEMKDVVGEQINASEITVTVDERKKKLELKIARLLPGLRK